MVVWWSGWLNVIGMWCGRVVGWEEVCVVGLGMMLKVKWLNLVLGSN